MTISLSLCDLSLAAVLDAALADQRCTSSKLMLQASLAGSGDSHSKRMLNELLRLVT